MTRINTLVAQSYANEPHLGSNLPQVEIQLSWRAGLSFLHCFALCSKVCSELRGKFPYLLQGAPWFRAKESGYGVSLR